jgi:hypothetical protein
VLKRIDYVFEPIPSGPFCTFGKEGTVPNLRGAYVYDASLIRWYIMSPIYKREDNQKFTRK